MATVSKPNIGADSRAAASGAVTREAPADILLRVEGLKMHFPITRGLFIQRQVGAVRAVVGLDF